MNHNKDTIECVRRRPTIGQTFRIGLATLGMALLLPAANVAADDETQWEGQVAWQDEMDPAFAEQVLAYVREYERPEFSDDHDLPPLSLWRPLPLSVMQELAEHWGHALYLDVRPATAAALEDSSSTVRRLLELAEDDPQTYPLQIQMMPASFFARIISDMPRYPQLNPVAVYIHEYFQETLEGYEEYPEDGFYEHFSEDAFFLDESGEPLKYSLSPRRGWPAVRQLGPTPEADEVTRTVAAMHARMLEAVAEHATPAVILNGGEYGFRKWQHHPSTEQLADPRVREMWEEDGQPWIEFASDRKAHQERLFKDVALANIEDAIYIHYSEVGGGHPRRSARRDWISRDFLYRPGISTHPSPRHYYRHGNSGFTGNSDLLSQVLNCRAQEIDAGSELTYAWLSQGWSGRPIADPELFRGFVKMLYASGAIGTINYGARPDQKETLPQLMIAAEVHAVFSHIDDFLYEGELLPGPEPHRWSRDLPAYEFPTGHDHRRVLVRRHDDREQWLVAAWAADGEAGSVTVDVPELGTVSIEARPSGNIRIYERVDGEPRPRPFLGVSEDMSLEELTQIMQTGHAPQRRFAIRQIADHGEAAQQQLVAALEDQCMTVRREAYRTLAHQADGKQYLRQGLDDPSSFVRHTVVGLLADLHERGRDVEPLLREIAEEGDGDAMATVAEALWPFEYDAETSSAIQRLEDAGADPSASTTIKLPAEGWRFKLDPQRRGHRLTWFDPEHNDDWERIEIESAWQEFGHDYVGVAWYRREFEVPDNEDYLGADLHFEGVDEAAWVWLNGEYVGGHDIGPAGWNEPFRIDVSDPLAWGESNTLVVRVMNTAAAGGIWEPVTLEIYEATD